MLVTQNLRTLQVLYSLKDSKVIRCLYMYYIKLFIICNIVLYACHPKLENFTSTLFSECMFLGKDFLPLSTFK